eukprot:CAMPEP_0201729950 /NCGR_PEP_ID=MMETSP0593-20130828/20574_1 /ASSEMBLY_ACC=CAM_ASM_000672 /TAXON_ID=267983 /ORGANISM="Skeletonema japonicum, Strain CCMP2506" /LENGTH=643 /DNA_ID=CAMNT_0048222387 /DNA_START=129 /DNA_END=2057 /DNA_ORIENTATION=-
MSNINRPPNNFAAGVDFGSILGGNNNNNNSERGGGGPLQDQFSLANNNNQHHYHDETDAALSHPSSSSTTLRRNLIDKDHNNLTWSRMALSPHSSIPPPRSGAASVVVKGRLYMFGGYGGGTGRLDDFYQFSFDTNTWSEVEVLSTVKPGCRENNGVVIGDANRVYLFGGYNGNSWLNDLWMFDIDTQCWTCIQESSDEYTTGGGGDGGQQNRLEHNERDHSLAVGAAAGGGGNDNNNNNNTGPSRRFGYVSVVHDNKFVLFGGFDGTRWLNDMFEFDLITNTWKTVQASGRLPSVRSCPAWIKDENYVYIHGGYDGVERKADFFACDLRTYTWSELPCKGTPPSPRYFHSCCIHGNKLYTYGGYSGSERLADMFAYDFETNHWSEVDCSQGECPSGRSSLVAQVYENSLYIFGGYNGMAVLNDFYKFRLKPVNIPPSGLVDDLRRLMAREDMSDVSFLVDGHEVFANRSILSIRSEYFDCMLFGGMRESLLDEHGKAAGGPIELRDVSHPVFLKVLEYLYTDTIRDLTWELSIPLMIASEQFMLTRLKALCQDHIRTRITVENVIGVFIASHQHNATGLKEIALEYIIKNLNDSAIVTGLAELKSEPDLLVEIITRHSAAQSSPTYASSNTNQLSGFQHSEW